MLKRAFLLNGIVVAVQLGFGIGYVLGQNSRSKIVKSSIFQHQYIFKTEFVNMVFYFDSEQHLFRL